MTTLPKSKPKPGVVRHTGFGNGHGGNGWGHGHDGALPVPKAKLGLWLLMGVGTILFSALFSAYVVRMGLGDWMSLATPQLLWLNTGLLVLGSISLHAAWRSARGDRLPGVRRRLLAGGAFGLAFLVGQIVAWQQLAELGYFASTTPASSFFYLITGLHGLHLVGGLVALALVAAGAWRGLASAQVRLRVELVTVYWHFLLAVWLVMFGLMLVT